MQPTRRHKLIGAERILVAAIVLIGALVRLWGLTFRLPYLYYPDEPAKIELAQKVLKTGDVNPHDFLMPPFYTYVNALAYVPYLSFASLFGKTLTIQSLQAPDMEALGTGIAPQPSTVILGRLISWFFASLSVLVVYLLVMRAYADRLAAAVSSLLVAFSPGMIPYSRLITPDSLVVFFCLLTVYACIGIFQRGRATDYVFAGISGALAASSKYSAVIVLVVPVAAHFLAHGLRGGLANKKLLISASAAVAAFVLLNPVALLSFSEFYRGATSEAAHYARGHQGMEGGALLWYLSYFWTTEGLISVLGVLGLIAAFWGRSRVSLLLATFPIVFFVFISSFVVRNDRTAIPITPYLYVFGIQFLVGVQDHFRLSHWAPLAKALTIVAAAALLAYSGLSVVELTRRSLAIDSREAARRWIEAQISPGPKFALESYSPYLDRARYHVIGVTQLIEHDTAWYRAREVDYVVASESMYGRFFDQPQLYQAQVAAYEELFSTYPLVGHFDDGGREIRIYRVP